VETRGRLLWRRPSSRAHKQESRLQRRGCPATSTLWRPARKSLRRQSKNCCKASQHETSYTAFAQLLCMKPAPTFHSIQQYTRLRAGWMIECLLRAGSYLATAQGGDARPRGQRSCEGHVCVHCRCQDFNDKIQSTLSLVTLSAVR